MMMLKILEVNRNKILFVIFILFVFSSCENKTHETQDLNEKRECIRVNDSIKICVKLIDGAIMDSFCLVNDRIEGLRKYVDPVDTVCYYLKYKNDKKSGFCRSFYNSGELRSEGEYVFDSKIGKWDYWNKNSNRDKVSFFDLNGNELFFVDYNLQKIRGNGILNVGFDIVGDSVITIVDIAVPNSVNGVLMIGEIDDRGIPKNILTSSVTWRENDKKFLDKRLFNKESKIKVYYQMDFEDWADIQSYEFKESFSKNEIDSLDQDLEKIRSITGLPLIYE